MLLSLIVLAQSVYVQGSSEGELELFSSDQMRDIKYITVLSQFSVILTTPKAVSVLGGYVVPVHDDIVFRCHAPGVHENGVLSWSIDLGPLTLNRIPTVKLEMDSNQKLTVNENYENNPAEVHIHNLQLNESGSNIQCFGYTGIQEVKSSIVLIFVEGQVYTISHLLTERVSYQNVPFHP